MPESRTPTRAGLEPMLESLIRLIEHQAPSMRCSVLLLDGSTLRHGAAPNLPEHYCRAIDGLRIGPGVGSCGTAAFERTPTIVADIATHPYWESFRDLALPSGLRACWSTPILGTSGQCLGTFAMYYDEPRAPSAADMELIHTASVLASALIEREGLLEVAETDRRALAVANEALEERQLELELANQQLQDSAAELEALNLQLQENATELEAQTEALEAANAELRASEERLRDVFEQVPVALAVLTGADHQYQFASPRYLSYVGGPHVLGKPIAEAVPGLAQHELIAALEGVYATGVPFQASESRVPLDLDGDGIPEDHFFNVACTPLRNPDGQVYAIAVAASDVTEQVNARREVELARADAEHANRAKSKFLATMSHELRTPLNAIGGYADLLLAGVRGELSTAQREDIERIQHSGRHLLGLINDILHFARIEAGRMEFRIEALPVPGLLHTLEEIVRPEIDARQLTYSQNVAEPDLAVLGDADKVRRILLNLVTNAVKFTEPGGRIAVECETVDQRARIRVHDTGRGIPTEHLQHIFDPFVQLDRDRTPASKQGVGLGLSISRELALAMGGALEASSVPGAGSTFTLTLPRAPTADHDLPAPARNARRPAARAQGLS